MDILKNSPAIVLLLISLSGFLAGEIIKGLFSRNSAHSHEENYIYTGYVSGICTLFLLLLSGFNIKASLYTFYTGALFGLMVMGQISASSLAMNVGPWAYTTVMMSLSTVIPTLSGAIFWGENLGITKITGIILMLFCFILSTKTDNNKTGTVKWFLLSLLASLCTGAIGLLQKAHQSSIYKDELFSFLIIAFLFSTIFSFSTAKIIRPKEKIFNLLKSKKNSIIFLFAGIGAAFNHIINLYLSGAMESAVFFPVMSGGELIFITVASILVFKEKLSKKQWTGLCSGIIAAIILCC